ncbi:Zinc transporter [Paramyrothecium foliicola]|nr:Zinc transporter [Paramyrothecium foliicola]
MGGILLLLGLCAAMAFVSFLAGAVPLSMSLSQSQLRLLSSVGVGVLVGTAMIVIIPEGVEASTAAPEAGHVHRIRTLVQRSPWRYDDAIDSLPTLRVREAQVNARDAFVDGNPQHISIRSTISRRQDDHDHDHDHTHEDEHEREKEQHNDDESHTEHADHVEVPTLEIGVSMVLGFVLMFLIDRLPRHATEGLQKDNETRHMSMDNLGGDTSSIDGDSEGFLGSMAPSPRRARSLATTIGLVIHAAADGIAMGASSTASDMKLSLIIFMAIMLHKAPAAFGLTSVLLKQGLSKRAARGHLIVFSLAAPVGALATYLLVVLLGGDNAGGDKGQWWTGMLLLFSGGTFLYVAMHAMQEDGSAHSHDASSGLNGYTEGSTTAQRKSKGPQMRDTLATVFGMLLPLLTQFGHHHH